METSLGNHQGTYDAVFQHPIARNLQWRDVHALLVSVADKVEEHADHLKFTRNGQTILVHPPKRKDFSDINELMHIRKFLEKSATPLQKDPAAGLHLLVVIDHRSAKIFETEMSGSIPQRITPLHADGEHRYLHNNDDDSNGQRKPEPKEFYDTIAKSLASAESILIFGSATGASSAMDHLVAQLKQHYPAISQKIIGAIVVDEHHLTDGQLLAKARDIYASPPTLAIKT